MISRIKLEEGNTEFWKHRFLGESYNDVPDKDIESEDPNPPDMLDEVDAVEDVTIETEVGLGNGFEPDARMDSEFEDGDNLGPRTPRHLER